MYKMLIADLDNRYIDDIHKTVRDNFKEISIIGTVSVGVEAIRIAEEEKPDILIISILLKEMMGMEVIRQLRKYNRDLYIIVISVYDNFDFVKDAFIYGVSNYLLKPLNPFLLRKELERALKELRRRALLKEKVCLSGKTESQIYEFADYSFIYTFLWNGKLELELKKYKAVLKLKSYGFVMNLEISDNRLNAVSDYESNYTIIFQTIKEFVADGYQCVVGPKVNNRIIVYVCVEEDQVTELNSVNYLKLAIGLRKELNEKLNMDVRIGIGDVRKVEDIHYSYESSVKALRYRKSSDVVHIENVMDKNISHEKYMEIEAKILQCVKFGKDECFEWVGRLMEMLEDYNLEERKSKVVEIIVLACHEVRQQAENEVNNLDYFQFVQELLVMDWENVKKWVYIKMEFILKALRTSRGSRKSDAVKEALVYMKENYNKELTLDIISGHVGITPQHFSKIFKEETGSNYVDWLNNLRIEKAKEYLLDGNHTIKEICFLVGLNDPNYFSRLFKKKAGKSPTEFVKLDKEQFNNKHYR